MTFLSINNYTCTGSVIAFFVMSLIMKLVMDENSSFQSHSSRAAQEILNGASNM